MLAEFSEMCDNMINSTNDEARRQMWNRAALKVLRLSAILAVSDNYMNPVVMVEHVEWAKKLILADIEVMKRRLDSGDVGLNDTSRERKVVAAIKDYLSKPVPKGYKVPDDMRQAGIVPRSFLQVRVCRNSAFQKYKMGPNKALDDAIANLVASGYLMEVKGDKLVEMFSHHGRGFRVLKLPDYDELARERN
jgi:hypothetical protein